MFSSIFFFSFFPFFSSSVSAFEVNLKEEGTNEEGDIVSFEILASFENPVNALQVNLELTGLEATDFIETDSTDYLYIPDCENGESYTDDSVCFSVVKSANFEDGELLGVFTAEISDENYIKIEAVSGNAYSDGESEYPIEGMLFSIGDEVTLSDLGTEEDGRAKMYQQDGLVFNKAAEVVAFAGLVIVLVIALYFFGSRKISLKSGGFFRRIFVFLALISIVNTVLGIFLIYDTTSSRAGNDVSVAYLGSGFGDRVRYYGDICGQNRVPALIEQNTISSSRKNVDYDLEPGIYAIKPIYVGESYLKGLELKVKLRDTGDEYKVWPRTALDDFHEMAGGDSTALDGPEVNPYHEFNPDSTFGLRLNIEKQRTVRVFKNGATSQEIEFVIAKCENKPSSIDYSDYIVCDDGETAKLIAENRMVSPGTRTYTKTYQAGDYTDVITGGKYVAAIEKGSNCNTAGIWYSSNGENIGANGYLWCGYGGGLQSTIPNLSVGVGSDFSVSRQTDIEYYFWTRKAEKDEVEKTTGEVKFNTYQCILSAVDSGADDTGGASDDTGSSTTTVEEKQNPQPVQCGAADSNGDGKFTIVDFSAFVKVYRGICASGSSLEKLDQNDCGNQDINGDGQINLVDFASFVKRYNQVSCGL